MGRASLRPALRRAWITARQSVVTVATIAVVLGVTMATFAVINGAVLKPISIPDLDRIVSVQTTRHGATSAVAFTPARLANLQARGPASLESWVGVAGGEANLTTDQVSQAVIVEQVLGPYFDLFQARPLAGRLLNATDSRAKSRCCAAVIGERVWRRTFGADPRAVGRTVRLLSRAFVIVGVAPEAFRGVRLPQMISTDVWIPAAALPQPPPAVNVFARLKPGVVLPAASAEIRSVSRNLEPDDPDLGAELLPAWRGMVPPPLVVIGSAVTAAAFVVSIAILLLGAATAVNLSRARFLSRRREFVVRLALGAEKAHLTRQAVADALAVSLPATLLGAAVGVVLIHLVQTTPLIPAAGAFVPRIDATLDLRVCAFVILAALGLTVLLARAEVEAMWTDPAAVGGGALNANNLGAGASTRMHLGAWQLAIATTLLVATGVFLRTGMSRLTRDATFPTDHAVVARVQLDASSRRPTVAGEFMSRLAALPPHYGGHVALLTDLPVPASTGIARVGVAYRAGAGANALTRVIGVSPGFLDAISLPLAAGVSLSSVVDSRADAVVIDETLARALWPAGDAVGRRLWFSGEDEPRTVVGVVTPPATASGLQNLRRFVFVPIESQHPTTFDVVLRGPGSDLALFADLRRIVTAADPNALLLDPQPLRDYVDPYASVATAALWPTMVAAGLAILMAIAGLFAVVHHNVIARLQEFGIRRALGAPSTRIYGMIVRESLGVVARGTAIGAVMSIPLVLVLPKTMLFALRVDDLAVMGAIPAGAFLTAVLAMLPPAYRATRSDPLAAMRVL